MARVVWKRNRSLTLNFWVLMTETWITISFWVTKKTKIFVLRERERKDGNGDE